MGRQISPERRKRLQQKGRQAALQGVVFEHLNQPNHRELAHHKGRQEVVAELLGGEASRRRRARATPDAEHDQGQNP